MAPVFLLPATAVHANGASPAMGRPLGWHTAQMTLGITAVVEQESLEDGVMLQVRTSRGNSVILLKKN